MAVTFVFEASRTLKSRGTQMSRIVRFWSFARFYAGKSPAFSGRVRSCRGERERESRRLHTFSPQTQTQRRSLGAPRTPRQPETHLCSFIIRPTLSQMWPEREAGPPFTFKISMLHVFCSSHGLAHFAALFIDPRA